MAILESNTDLDVKGRVLATTVPNSTGSVVTWNDSTKVFGLRTNAQIISDLGLSTVVSNSHSHSNLTVLNGITSALVSNWNTAFGWGNHSGLYALVGRSITAGNGLSGGGTLAANRTITLGTPSAITLSSTNSVTTSSHTHAFTPGGTTAQYIRGDGSLATFVDTTYTAGTGLSLSGTTFSVKYGTAAGTAAQGNDSRINNGQTAFGWGNHAGLYVSKNEYKNFGNIVISSASGSTADFIARLTAIGFFNYSKAVGKASWNYAGNQDITDTPYGSIETAGAVIETWYSGSAFHIIVYCANTGGSTPGRVFMYNDQGPTYSPGWREIMTDNSPMSGYVPTSRTITINGVAQNLSANRTWTVADTITRLRGTTSGTYVSGDLTLLAGSNTSISQSGNNITISSTNTNTTYTAGTGLSLTGTTFGQTITTSGTGTYVQSITQTTNGFQVNLGTPPNTTYSAGSGLTLSGTTFSLPITYSGSGDYIANIVQNTNGLTVTRATLPTFNDAITSISRNGVNIPIVSKNVDIPIFSTTGAGLVPPRVGSVATKYLREDGTWVTPPNTNTTYSAGTLALLQAGTDATNRVWSAKVLADGVIRKEVNNVNPAGQPFSIYANGGTLDWAGNGFSFYTDSGNKFNYIDDEQAIGVNHFESYGFYLSGQRLRFTSNNINSELLPANGESNSKLPVTGMAGRILAIGATNGSTTEYANTNGVINISSLVNQSTGNFVSKSGINIIDYTGWTLDSGVRFGVNNVGIYVSGNDSTNPNSDGYQTHFEVNVEESFIGMSSGGATQSGFKIYNNSKGFSYLKAPDNVTTTRSIPIGIRQNGDTFYSDTEGVINLPTSVSNTTFHNNTHNSTSGNQTVTLTNTSYPRIERVFYNSTLCGTLTIRKYAPVDGDEIIVQGRQCTIVIKKSSSVSHTIFTPSSHDLVTSVTLVNLCYTGGLQSVHLRYMSNYQSWVVLSASITNAGYFV